MNAILFGFKGSGKTYYGRKLAKALHRTFIDTDELLGEPERLYEQLGERGFREKESQVVESLLGTTNAVVAVGGGTVLDPKNVERLQKLGQLIYLEASFESLRIASTPAFAKDKDLEKIYGDRKPIYDSIPSRRVNVNVLDEAGVLAALRSIVLIEEPPNGF